MAIGFIVESVEPCSEDLIKEMAVEACGLGFRSIFPQLNESVYYWLTNPKFKMNSMSKDDVEREYRKIIGDDYGRGEDLISNNMINIKGIYQIDSSIVQLCNTNEKSQFLSFFFQCTCIVLSLLL